MDVPQLRCRYCREGENLLLPIANDGPLGPEWSDHPLKGDRGNHRDCHIGGHFLLVYRPADAGRDDIVVFARAGTHADLFGE